MVTGARPVEGSLLPGQHSSMPEFIETKHHIATAASLIKQAQCAQMIAREETVAEQHGTQPAEPLLLLAWLQTCVVDEQGTAGVQGMFRLLSL